MVDKLREVGRVKVDITSFDEMTLDGMTCCQPFGVLGFGFGFLSGPAAEAEAAPAGLAETSVLPPDLLLKWGRLSHFRC
jgi:hypothetical protein